MNVIRAARTGALLALAVVVAALAGCGQKPAQPAAARSSSPHASSSASAGNIARQRTPGQAPPYRGPLRQPSAFPGRGAAEACLGC